MFDDLNMGKQSTLIILAQSVQKEVITAELSDSLYITELKEMTNSN